MHAARLDNLKAQRVAAGHSIQRLAQLANVSDLTIRQLEEVGTTGLNIGGTCTHMEADRLCNALGISRATAGFSNHAR